MQTLHRTVVEDAVNVALVTVQFSTAGGAILTLGVVVFCVTVVEADAVQPFAGSVAETVYVPAVETFSYFLFHRHSTRK
jgi:hypothetical protein